MPQTLLALLGLSLTMLLAFNQQRVTVKGQQNQLTEEYRLAASGVMMHVMEMVAARSFDEATTPEKIYNGGVPHIPDRTAFASPSGFGMEGPCDLMVPANTPSCDDVDDVHGIQWQSVAAELPGGRSLPFEVSLEVFYVEDGALQTPVSYPTNHKRVVLRARTPLLQTDGPLVQLERVVAYDPVKAEVEYGDVEAYADVPIESWGSIGL